MHYLRVGFIDDVSQRINHVNINYGIKDSKVTGLTVLLDLRYFDESRAPSRKINER